MAKKAASKPLIFISHSNDEKRLADVFADLIRVEFREMVEVFVSSVGLGKDRFRGTTNALEACEIGIVFASPSSVKRPWINFELGAMWCQGKTVIPLCHSGMTRSDLPSPFSHLQSTDATNSDDLQDIFDEISDQLKARRRKVDFSQFIELMSSV